MTATLATHPPSLLDELVSGEPTLGEVISGAWEGLAAHQPVPCPVCGDSMRPQYSVHSLPVGGVCGGCGTTLR